MGRELAAAGGRPAPHGGGLDRSQRWAAAFFGVRGVGSLYDLAYAAGEADVLAQDWLWSTVALTVVASVLGHGELSTPAMSRLERRPDPEPLRD